MEYQAADNRPRTTVDSRRQVDLDFRSCIEMIAGRMVYIHDNPVKAGLVEKPEDYLYSSARNYSGLKVVIEVDYC